MYDKKEHAEALAENRRRDILALPGIVIPEDGDLSKVRPEKRYEYFNGAPSLSGLTHCTICGSKKVRWAFHDLYENNCLVAICSAHRGQALRAQFVRNEERVFYPIESGWETNPIWYCPVSLTETRGVCHLHTTPAAGEAPSVFSGEVSGLMFRAGGSDWPIEAREGRLVHAVWTNGVETEQDVTATEAAAILSQDVSGDPLG